MYEIVMAVCSILHAGGCHAVRLPVSPEQTAIPYMAMKSVEFEMAKWRADNPEYIIAKWALTPISRIASDG